MFTLKETNMKKIIYTSIMIILAVILACILLQDRFKSYGDTEVVDALNDELHAIAKERQALNDELSELTTRQQSSDRGLGTVSIVFTQIDSFVYTHAYPNLIENGFVAALGLSPDSLPGLSGCISDDQFDELISEEWSTFLVYDGKSPISNWLISMKKLLREKHIDMPSVIYFPAESYSKELDEVLEQYDIEIILHHGEENLPVITTTVDSDFFRISSVGWTDANAPSRTQSAMNRGGSLAFIVGSEHTDEKHEKYKDASFSNMMEKLSNWVTSDTLIVTDLLSSRDYRAGVIDAREMTSKDFAEKKEDIARRLDQLEERRRALVENTLN